MLGPPTASVFASHHSHMTARCNEADGVYIDPMHVRMCLYVPRAEGPVALHQTKINLRVQHGLCPAWGTREGKAAFGADPIHLRVLL